MKGITYTYYNTRVGIKFDIKPIRFNNKITSLGAYIFTLDDNT